MANICKKRMQAGFSYIMHTDPKTNSKVFAHIDITQHISLELNFLSCVDQSPIQLHVTDALQGNKVWLVHIWKNASHQKTCLLFPIVPVCVCCPTVLQNIELLSINTVRSIWTARSKTLLTLLLQSNTSIQV